MSDEKRIPITHKAAVETKYGERAPTLTSSGDSLAAAPAEPKAAPSGEIAVPSPTETQNASEQPWTVGAAEGDTKAAKKNRRAKAEIGSLEQFIEQVYARKGAMVTLNAKTEKRIRGGARLDAKAIQRLVTLGQKDALFGVPRQLLLTARQTSDLTIRSGLREFVRELMLGHPLFGHPEISAAIRNLPDAPDVIAALRLVMTSPLSVQRDSVPKSSLKLSALATLRTNATNCLAIWVFESRGLTLENIAEALYAALWSANAGKTTDDSAKLRALTANEDLTALGVACSAFKGLADERARGQDAALRAAAIARNEIDSVRLELVAETTKVAELEEQVRSLKHALEEEKTKSEAALTHLRADTEQQRTRVLRRLKDDVTLLDDGLYALSRDPPKVHVMDDHAERVLHALRREIRNLEGKGE